MTLLSARTRLRVAITELDTCALPAEYRAARQAIVNALRALDSDITALANERRRDEVQQLKAKFRSASSRLAEVLP